MSANVFLKKLRLRNFRSVRDTEITFDNPLFLVGRNGSGKSNVVDAIAFLSDCVNSSLGAAMKARDFLSRAVFIGTDYEWPYVELNVEFNVGNASSEMAVAKGFYHLRLKIIRVKSEREDGYSREFNSSYLVDYEECYLERGEAQHFFKRTGDAFETNVPGINPRLGSQNLALTVVGGVEEFALLADGFAAMRVYHIDHRKIRSEEGVEASLVLSETGANIAGVLFRLTNQWETDSINSALHLVTPRPTRLLSIPMNDGTFRLHGIQQQSDSNVVGFDRQAFSDGTLYAMAVAVALQQHPPPSVVVIEEPENNLHPGALIGIAEMIEDAARKTQVIITTHSPDLLDAKWIKPENLRVVVWEDDASRVAELAEMPKNALREHLMYAGQLMRANALEAAPAKNSATETETEALAPAAP